MRNWFQHFMAWYGQELPDSYLAFDLETTGFKRDYDVPVDIGHVLVVDRQIRHRGHFLLNWCDYPGIEEGWLDDRMSKAAFGMSQSGKTYGYSTDLLRSRGKDPVKVLSFYHKLFTTTRENGFSFLGHNAYFFDAVMLEFVMRECCGLEWQFREGELFDSGAMEKAAFGQIDPRPGELLSSFFSRVHGAVRKGLTWSIEACVERYQLAAKYDLGSEQLHSAESDAYVSHLLFEEHRRQFLASKPNYEDYD